MAYEIHIERKDGQEIGLDEWKQAVEATDGIRLATDNMSFQNPRTGQTIGFEGGPGDVEMHFPDSEEWLPCIRFAHGRGSFKATKEFDEDTSSFRQIVRAVSAKLDAHLVGDEGEVYP